MFKPMLINIGVILGAIIGGPLIFIYLLSVINHNTKVTIATRINIKGQLWFGFLGVIIHEASHLLMALIFHHRINSFRLLKQASYADPTLGYVNHQWDPASLYQKMGNLFIGIAPIFGCCGAILLSARLLLPNVYNWLMTLTQSPLSSVPTDFPSFQWPSALIFLLLSANICIGGFDLSTADYRNSLQGMVTTVLFLVIIAVVISLFSVQTLVFSTLLQLTKGLVILSSFNVVISLGTNLIFKLF